jgi:hypothetical protein
MRVQACDRESSMMIAEQDIPDRKVLDGAGGEKRHGESIQSL